MEIRPLLYHAAYLSSMVSFHVLDTNINDVQFCIVHIMR